MDTATTTEDRTMQPIVTHDADESMMDPLHFLLGEGRSTHSIQHADYAYSHWREQECTPIHSYHTDSAIQKCDIDDENTIVKSGMRAMEPLVLAGPINGHGPSQRCGHEHTQIPMLEHQQIGSELPRNKPLPEETEEFLSTMLDEMEIEISKVVSKLGYEMAMQRNPDYAQDRQLREMFLRSESYRPQYAARRFLAWFDSILLHFGAEALVRPLRLSDLSAEAYHLLTLGKFQAMPTPDAKGRAVLVFYKNTCDTYTKEAAMEATHYITSTLSECAFLQRNGGVVVHKFDVVPGTPEEHVEPDMYTMCEVKRPFPIRLEAFHFLSDQQHHRNPTDVDEIKKHVCEGFLDRFHAHLRPSHQSNLHQLSALGITTNDLPTVDRSCDILTSHHMNWVMKRTITEGCGILAPNSIMRQNTFNLDQLFLRPLTTKAIAGASGLQASDSPCNEQKQGAAVGFAACSTASDQVSMTPSTKGDSSGTHDTRIPTDHDVLMGLGHRCLQHPGNKFLRSIVADRSKEYDKASRAEKYDMAKDIVRIIYKKRGRFLKKDADKDSWSEATWCVAREKVAHAFRKRRELDLAKAKKAKNRVKSKT